MKNTLNSHAESDSNIHFVYNLLVYVRTFLKQQTCVFWFYDPLCVVVRCAKQVLRESTCRHLSKHQCSLIAAICKSWSQDLFVIHSEKRFQKKIVFGLTNDKRHKS